MNMNILIESPCLGCEYDADGACTCPYVVKGKCDYVAVAGVEGVVREDR